LGWFSWVGVVCLGWVCEGFVMVRGFWRVVWVGVEGG